MKSDLDMIWGYFDMDLEEEDMKRMEQRLNSDPAFQKLFSEQKEIYESLRKTNIIAFRKKLQKIGQELKKNNSSGKMIFLSYPWLIAAAAGLLCLTTGYFLLRLSAGETTPPPVFSSLPVKDSTDTLRKDTFSLNRDDMYEINPRLDKLTDIHYRNAVLKTVLPENGQIFAQDAFILFSCHVEPPDSVYISILNNNAQVILERFIPSGGFVLEPGHQKGLFYFQLSTGKEIICTRKFFIR